MKLRKVYLTSAVFAVTTTLVLGFLLLRGYGSWNLSKVMGLISRIPFQTQGMERGEPSIPEAYVGKLQLFILAGQSNMAGVADMPKTALKTHPKIYVFGNDYRWKLAKEPVDSSIDQVDRVSRDNDAGFGPSVSFAETLLEQRPAMVIGLIPCAKGGSSIAEWRRNLSDQTLYGSCLKRVRAASPMGNVAGLLYFQGEIDTVDPKEQPGKTLLPGRWADEFKLLVEHWRRDFNLPELLIVFAQIGTNTEPDRFKHWTVVKAQQRQVQLPFTAMITTDDLALEDYVHFTSESYQTIGQRFAKAYLALLAAKATEDSRSGKPR